MSARRAIAIHVWYDDHQDVAEDERWTVSTVDAEDDEVTCLGGWPTLTEAWEDACSRADDSGMPAIKLWPADQELDRYEPARVADESRAS